jgi:autotransporter-associated beta strand protein
MDGAPTSSESNVALIFPAAARSTNADDIANLTVQSITFSANDYVITGSQPITLTDGISADAGVNATDALNLNITLGAATTITVTTAGATLKVGGNISGTGGLTKTGGGTLVVSGANSYTGDTEVRAGTLQAGAANTLSNTSRFLRIFSGATLDLNDFNQTTAGLLGEGSVKLGMATLTTNTGGYDGLIGGTGGVTKIGASDLSLAGRSIYTGPTLVAAGTLELLGDLSSSDVTVRSGALLGGSGRVKSITVAGTVAPNALQVDVFGPGILRTGNVVFTPGSRFHVLIGTFFLPTFPSSSQLNVTDGASLTGNPTLELDFRGFRQPAVGDTFTIIDSAAGARSIQGTFNGLPNGATVTVNGVTFRINYDSRVTLTVVPPLTANQRFVTQLYVDLLRRQPDPGGLSVWASVLDRGVPRSQVARSIQDSLEYHTLVVQGTYQLYLHRAAEPEGVGTWVNFLSTGGTIERLREIFAGSAEYMQSRGNGTTNGFLDALYQDGLNRSIDPGARTAFGQALDTGALSRAQVAALVFGSVEFRQRLVGNLYLSFLHRSADAAGLQIFAEALRLGIRQQDVLASIIGSDEYFAQV